MTTNEPFVGRVLLLSTANYPQEPDFGALRHVDTNYGTVVWLMPRGQPDWMKPIFKKAQELGCSMIEFDRDNDTDESLPVYDW